MLCGQYPGAVPNGATVSVLCAHKTHVYERRSRFRYVIVQFPIIDEPLNVCEIEVFTVGMCVFRHMLANIIILSATFQLSDHLQDTCRMVAPESPRRPQGPADASPRTDTSSLRAPFPTLF